MGPQAKLPGISTASKRWLVPHKDWEECVCPQNEKLHQEVFKLNWKGEGDTKSEVRTDEGKCTIRGTG